MTHEFKNYIDLSQFEGITPGEWNHYETEGGVSFIEDANGNPLFEAHNAGLQDCRLVVNTTRTLAYARELEARIEKMQAAGDALVEHAIEEDEGGTERVEYKRVLIEAWRNA